MSHIIGLQRVHKKTDVRVFHHLTTGY